jgi:hypothetical protein
LKSAGKREKIHKRDTMSARGRWLLLFKWSPEPPNEPGAIHLILQKNFLFGRQATRGPCVPGYTIHPDDYK